MSEINKEDNNKEVLEKEQKDTIDIAEKKLKEETKEKTIEEKLKESEEKLLRSLAEIENQRRRFEKEIKDAFEFGSFNFSSFFIASFALCRLSRIAKFSFAKLKEPNSNASFISFSNLLR